MRIQTRREAEEQARARRMLRQDLKQVNAEKAGMAIDLKVARQWLDRWRNRALNAEALLREQAEAMSAARAALVAENEKLRAEAAALKREEACD